jgi:tetraacyldisaccharide 4'-kinase
VGISRADVIVLTKCNLVVEDQIQSLKKLIPQNKETLNFGYDIQTFVSINSEVKTREEVLGKKFFLVSAIGRPDVFEKMMGKIGVVSKESLHFRDHHQYSDEDLQQILNKFNKSECDYLITTQKDAVKLIPMVKKMNSAPLIWSAHLDVNELEKRGRLDELIHHYLR